MKTLDATPTIHAIDSSSPEINKKRPVVMIAVIVIALVAGIGTGYLMQSQKGGGSLSMNKSEEGSDISDEEAIETAGIKNEETFKDKAEGILQEGGIEGEGAFHLERPGGESQTAYLTSTTVDLSPFVGKKIRVWGKTFQGEKAGWLMDVGYVELLR